MRQLKSLHIILTLIILLTILQGCIDNQGTEEGNHDGQTEKKILVIIPPTDYDPGELIKITTSLTDRGVRTVTATRGNNSGQPWGGEEGIDADIVITDNDTGLGIGDYTALVFIGGEGAKSYYNDTMIHAIVKKAHKIHLVLAAIGTAPLIIVNALPDLIKGKQIACDPSISSEVADRGAIPIEEDVVVEDTMVTASGEEQVPVFVDEILQLLESSP